MIIILNHENSKRFLCFNEISNPCKIISCLQLVNLSQNFLIQLSWQTKLS